MNDDVLTKVIKDAVKSMGYTFVIVNFHPDENKSILQVMIENKDGSGVTITDCQKVSKRLAATLDVEDIIDSAYNLEVSSTGMDRPLTIIEDYDRFTDFLIKLETHELVGGRKKFKGKVIGRKDNAIYLEMPEGKIEIDFDNVRRAKLVVTDEMIRRALNKSKNN